MSFIEKSILDVLEKEGVDIVTVRHGRQVLLLEEVEEKDTSENSGIAKTYFTVMLKYKKREVT